MRYWGSFFLNLTVSYVLVGVGYGLSYWITGSSAAALLIAVGTEAVQRLMISDRLSKLEQLAKDRGWEVPEE